MIAWSRINARVEFEMNARAINRVNIVSEN